MCHSTTFGLFKYKHFAKKVKQFSDEAPEVMEIILNDLERTQPQEWYVDMICNTNSSMEC